MKTLLTGAILAAATTSISVQAAPDLEEMWKIIQSQQAEIERLKGQVNQAEIKVEATADAVDKVVESGSSASSVEGSWVERTKMGGYGELHYNNLDNEWDNPAASGNVKDVDFHRFVLFVSHQFSDSTRLFTEIELEHSLSGDGKPGEVELEQAYIEHDLNDRHRLKAGQFLVPVGLLNETHEPETFYGVERNNVEKNIIPSTWWEAGLAFSGELAPGVNYDLAATSGFGLDPVKGQYKVRDGRQKVAKADAESLAYTARIKYTGIAGLELGATVQYQEDLYQEQLMVAGDVEEVDGLLVEAHAAWQQGPFALRALYAKWNLDDAIENVKIGADQQEGWYIEPAYRINEQWGVFARYSEWDNQAGDNSVDSDYEQIDLGVNWWLEPNVVVKFDIQSQETPGNKDEYDGFNLGLGYSF